METFPLDHFAIYVELAEPEDTTDIFNASEASNVRNKDILQLKKC